MGNCTFKAIYFVSVSIWGYQVLKDQYYMPVYLGGKGDFFESMDYHPYAKHAPQLKEYLLLPMGYHMGGLFALFLKKTRTNDFVEMGLHHVVTMYLFGGCYLYNIQETGAAIAFLHDLADVTTNIAKLLGETKYKNVAVIYFILQQMPVWFYTRCLVLPYMIYTMYLIGIKTNQNQFVNCFFCYLLGCLFMLHCFWFSIFVRMISKFIFEGKAEDL